MFCLPKEYLIKIKQAIKEGKFDMEKFNTTSEARRSMLAEIVGKENAEQVNLIYEKKLLLKNQEATMYKFVEDITGVSAKAKAETAAKIKATYADKNRRLYDPTENENFLNEITSDIYSKKYKTEISLEEAQTITELSQDAKMARERLIKSGKDGIFAEKVALDNYVNALRLDAIKEGFINPLKEVGIRAKVGAIVDNAKISVKFVAENSRAMVASMDNSLWFRQGMRALFDPRTSKIWVQDFAKSWGDIFKTMRGKIGKGATGKDVFLGTDAIRAGDLVLDSIKAEAYGRQNYLNGRYEGKVGAGERGTKLDIGTGEEAYPTSKPSMIPVFGRFFKGSEVAYEGGAMRLRMDIADYVYKWAEKNGYDLKDNKIIGDLNEVVNGMTGRGTFGKRAGGFEKSVNIAFFSIKFFKSNLDYLTLHQGRLSIPATKFAATNLLYTVSNTAIMMGMAKTLYPEDNKDIFNPTSSNFGKMRFGNMTFDLTHGAGGIVVAMSKIILQQSTSGTTGITTKLGEGYGSQTGMDVFWNFTENKFSPMFSVIKEVVEQRTFEGGKPTILGEVGSLITPILIQNIPQNRTEPVAMQIIGLIADGVGISVNVYAPSTNWGQDTGVELQQFKEKVGEEKFQEANDKFNTKYNEWFISVKKNPTYIKLSDEDKKKVIIKKKNEIKNIIFRQYNFKPTKTRVERLPNL